MHGTIRRLVRHYVEDDFFGLLGVCHLQAIMKQTLVVYNRPFCLLLAFPSSSVYPFDAHAKRKKNDRLAVLERGANRSRYACSLRSFKDLDGKNHFLGVYFVVLGRFPFINATGVRDSYGHALDGLDFSFSFSKLFRPHPLKLSTFLARI